jgi:hypothetical protein
MSYVDPSGTTGILSLACGVGGAGVFGLGALISDWYGVYGAAESVQSDIDELQLDIKKIGDTGQCAKNGSTEERATAFINQVNQHGNAVKKSAKMAGDQTSQAFGGPWGAAGMGFVVGAAFCGSISIIL